MAQAAMMDTHEEFTKLVEAGLEEKAAEAVVKLHARAQVTDSVTKADLKNTETFLMSAHSDVQAALKSDISDVQASLKSEIADVKSEFNDFREDVSSRFDKVDDRFGKVPLESAL